MAVAAHGPMAAGGHAHGAVGQVELAGPRPLHRHMVGPFKKVVKTKMRKLNRGFA